MMNKVLHENLENRKKYLFLPVNSRCLRFFSDLIVTVPDGDSPDSMIIRDSLPYKRILGINYLELSSFESSGFYDERFDSALAYGTMNLMNSQYLVVDSDGLKKTEMEDIEYSMKKVVRRKGKYEYSDGLLVERLDLNNASGILFFTKDAKQNLKNAGLDRKIQRFNLIRMRTESFKNFHDFDNKILSGELKEFEWD